jgi:hypothetical protein
MAILDSIEIVLQNAFAKTHSIYLNVFDTSLSRKWYNALQEILEENLHLEKNYLWHGWADSKRNGEYLCEQINKTIEVINNSNLDYHIDDNFTVENTLIDVKDFEEHPLKQNKLNNLHRYFEDLQGTTQNLSPYYIKADHTTKWHIRQLNNLCHEFESWALSNRKKKYLPKWQRPALLFCWLNAPKFELTKEDFNSFGIDALCKDFGGIYLGVNKAVGKHHYEVFRDEDGARIDELTTIAMRGQTLAAGDFDIDLGRTDRTETWRIEENKKFRQWLIDNKFDPNDKNLTLGHPKVGQIDLHRSFGTGNTPEDVWEILYEYHDVYQIKTNGSNATFDYRWSDHDYMNKQIETLRPGYIHTEKTHTK